MKGVTEKIVTPPKVYISIRENFVGQNKSNVTLMFDYYMAQSF